VDSRAQVSSNSRWSVVLGHLSTVGYLVTSLRTQVRFSGMSICYCAGREEFAAWDEGGQWGGKGELISRHTT
jgi:hypothetical protein